MEKERSLICWFVGRAAWRTGSDAGTFSIAAPEPTVAQLSTTTNHRISNKFPLIRRGIQINGPFVPKTFP